MKLTTVLSLVLAFTFNAHSQYFGEQGATWHYNKTYYSVPEVSYSKVWIEGTETHLGKTCQTIRLKNIGSCNEISSTTCLFENDSAVYLWEARDTSYKLLFDFKAKIGDTINQEFVTWQNNADTNSFKIDSIAFVTINGIKLKEFYYTPILGCTRRGGQKTIIEKIGFLDFFSGPFFDGACDMSYSQGLRCFESPSFGFYNTNEEQECTHSTLGIEPSKLHGTLNVFPNPSNGTLQLKGLLPNNEYRVSITNLQGQIEMSTKYQDSETLGLSGLLVGVYHISVSLDNILIANEKLIISE